MKKNKKKSNRRRTLHTAASRATQDVLLDPALARNARIRLGKHYLGQLSRTYEEAQQKFAHPVLIVASPDDFLGSDLLSVSKMEKPPREPSLIAIDAGQLAAWGNRAGLTWPVVDWLEEVAGGSNQQKSGYLVIAYGGATLLHWNGPVLQN